MHRKHLLKLLTHYLKDNPAESAEVNRYIQFVKEHEDCFERQLSVGHVTGSAWLLNPSRTHVLLTHHRKLDRWLQLGGHADGESNVLNVALREAEEESGISNIKAIDTGIFDLDIHPIPAKGDEAAHYHYDVRFAIQVDGSDNYTVSDESHALAWVPITGIADKTQEESMLRMQKKVASISK